MASNAVSSGGLKLWGTRSPLKRPRTPHDDTGNLFSREEGRFLGGMRFHPTLCGKPAGRTHSIVRRA